MIEPGGESAGTQVFAVSDQHSFDEYADTIEGLASTPGTHTYDVEVVEVPPTDGRAHWLANRRATMRGNSPADILAAVRDAVEGIPDDSR